MIGYRLKAEALKARIPGKWRTKTEAFTEAARAAGKYIDHGNVWSEIKPVYMEIQRNKCAYCERPLAGVKYGKVECDVEHFRPKSSVKAWPIAGSEATFPYPTGGASAKGYHLLAYHPLNYAVACKPCNSTLKSDHFPIAGKRQTNKGDPVELASEKPFLIYPVGDIDEEPMTLITFDGPVPMPAKKRGEGRRRAEVTIEFFKLAPEQREELLRQRSEKIVGLYLAFNTQKTGSAAAKRVAEGYTRYQLSTESPHTNCGIAFHRLLQVDFAQAERLAEAAQAYLDSQGG